MPRITWLPGMRITAERLNQPLFVGGRSTTPLTFTSGTWGPIYLDTVAVDTDGGWSAGAPSRYTAQVPGWYRVRAGCAWVANAAGSRGVRLQLNAVPIVGACVLAPAATSPYPTALQVEKDVLLAVGDWIEGQGLQNSGGPLNSTSGFDVGPIFEVSLIHG